MSTTIATYTAFNADAEQSNLPKTTTIRVQASFNGRYYADSDDLGMGHQFDENNPRKIATELARRHGYDLLTEKPKRVTFDEFQSSGKWSDDLSTVTAICFNDDVVPGYVYLDGSFYIEFIERTAGDDRPCYNVVLGNGEYLFASLAEAEEFLWDEFAVLELNHWLRHCNFSFDDEESYEGFTDGSTWNGWDNVCVTEKVHHNIVEWSTFAQPAAEQKRLEELLEQPQSEERDEEIYCINPFVLIEQDEYRLYDYGNCFTAQIDEPKEHNVVTDDSARNAIEALILDVIDDRDDIEYVNRKHEELIERADGGFEVRIPVAAWFDEDEKIRGGELTIEITEDFGLNDTYANWN
jgi:hypothetical protein